MAKPRRAASLPATYPLAGLAPPPDHRLDARPRGPEPPTCDRRRLRRGLGHLASFRPPPMKRDTVGLESACTFLARRRMCAHMRGSDRRPSRLPSRAWSVASSTAGRAKIVGGAPAPCAREDRRSPAPRNDEIGFSARQPDWPDLALVVEIEQIREDTVIGQRAN